MHRLIIDTETTGLSPRFHKTLTVGLLLADIEKTHLKILDQNHIFIKHDSYNASRQAMAINKINLEEHNQKAISPSSACKQINSFIKTNSLHSTPLVGHNIAFDKNFLSSLFDQRKTKNLLYTETEDTMWMWKSLQRKNIVPFHLRVNLGTVANYFNIDYESAHDALADCHITAKVYHEILKLI